MSESILNALIHLFALVANANEKRVSERGRSVVTSYLRLHLDESKAVEYLKLFDDYFDSYSRQFKSSGDEAAGNLLMKFQMNNVCGQIKRELHQNEKIIVFLRLLEYVNEDSVFSDSESEFIDAVAESFNISPGEVKDAKAFILDGHFSKIDHKNLLIIEKPGESSADDLKGAWIEKHKPRLQEQERIIERDSLDGSIIVLYIRSTGTIIFRYIGDDKLTFEGKQLLPYTFYVFNRGGIIRGDTIEPIYYSEVSTSFLEAPGGVKIVLTAENIEFRYPLSQNGIRPFSFSEESGQLIGIMGVSGSGKSTLLNVLNGKLKPRRGKILINTFDIHKDAEKIEGQIGFVPQDDLLIEELSVYQNLYYNARLCFGNLKEERITEIIEKVLSDLGLDEIRDLKVGNPLNKFISGGQRKRLNIGLELMREPSILFIDEPTSGLSSLDSDIVMALLKEQSMKGKLVIANIHQPSSDNFKLLDKLWIIDKGGYPIYTGNPLDALVYFKTVSGHINPEQTECNCCGNIASEQILKIIDKKELSPTGYHTQIRKVQPEEWYDHYKEKIAPENKEKTIKDGLPPNMFSLPGINKQFWIFSIRNMHSKISNRQYLMVSLLVAPVLAFIMTYFIKHFHEGQYIFAENVNLPAYLLMTVIMALFLGMSISADEIIKDRKILERESLLHLSWFSYLNSKIVWVFLLSAIQSISFILIGNLIMEIKDMTLSFWLILFSAACFANMLGLLISSAFNSNVTIYILVPFLLVPQLLLGGVVVKYDDMHDSVTNKVYVPLAGDLMASRWAYEALAVEQFKRNRFQKHFFEYEQQNSAASFKASYLIPRLLGKVQLAERDINLNRNLENIKADFIIIRNEIKYLQESSGLMPFEYSGNINIEEFGGLVVEETENYLRQLQMHFLQIAREAASERDRVYRELEEKMGSAALYKLREDHHNKALADILLNRYELDVIYETGYRLIQKKDPIYHIPGSNIGRAHFYAPMKRLYKYYFDTFWYNISVLWFFSLILYICILTDLPGNTVRFFESLGLLKKR